MKKQLIAAIALLGLVLAPVAFAQFGGAPTPGGTFSGNLVTAIMRIINGILMFAGIVALIYLIIGGFRYIISQGDESQAEQAKNTILFAVIGLLVIGLAAALVNFVVGLVNSGS